MVSVQRHSIYQVCLLRDGKGFEKFEKYDSLRHIEHFRYPASLQPMSRQKLKRERERELSIEVVYTIVKSVERL